MPPGIDVGCVANQPNIKNKNNLNFQFNEYVSTIFLYAKHWATCWEQSKEKNPVQIIVPIILLSNKEMRQASKQKPHKNSLGFQNAS